MESVKKLLVGILQTELEKMSIYFNDRLWSVVNNFPFGYDN